LFLQEGEAFVEPDFRATVSFLCLDRYDVVKVGCFVCVSDGVLVSCRETMWRLCL
jgi:hypothetical protein